VKTGWGISVRTPLGLPSGLQILDAELSGLPSLPTLGLALYTGGGGRSAAAERLSTLIKERLAVALAS
jgi:hypothetical protein